MQAATQAIRPPNARLRMPQPATAAVSRDTSLAIVQMVAQMPPVLQVALCRATRPATAVASPATSHVTAQPTHAWTAPNATSAAERDTLLATARTLPQPEVSKAAQVDSRVPHRPAASAELEASETARCSVTAAEATVICHATVPKALSAITVTLDYSPHCLLTWLISFQAVNWATSPRTVRPRCPRSVSAIVASSQDISRLTALPR